MARPIARFVVTMSSDGSVASHGPIDEVPLKDGQGVSASEIGEHKQEENIDVDGSGSSAPAETEENNKSDGKLIAAEEIDIGHVSWSASMF